MHIVRFVVNMVRENCYILWDDHLHAAVIDCGALYPEEEEAIDQCIRENGLKLVGQFNTHGHFDHVFGARYLEEKYGVKLGICAAEKQTYESAAEQMRRFIGVEADISLATVGSYFQDGDKLRVGEIELEVIATPGHTPGGVCFYAEKEGVLFSGDSLFRSSIGRCDLPGGNEFQLRQSLKNRILTLPDEVKVLPGHGEATTIAEEKQTNLYLR